MPNIGNSPKFIGFTGVQQEPVQDKVIAFDSLSDEEKILLNDETFNASIDLQLHLNDLNIIRALASGDKKRITAHKKTQDSLRLQRR